MKPQIFASFHMDAKVPSAFDDRYTIICRNDLRLNTNIKQVSDNSLKHIDADTKEFFGDMTTFKFVYDNFDTLVDNDTTMIGFVQYKRGFRNIDNCDEDTIYKTPSYCCSSVLNQYYTNHPRIYLDKYLEILKAKFQDKSEAIDAYFSAGDLHQHNMFICPVRGFKTLWGIWETVLPDYLQYIKDNDLIKPRCLSWAGERINDMILNVFIQNPNMKILDIYS